MSEPEDIFSGSFIQELLSDSDKLAADTLEESGAKHVVSELDPEFEHDLAAAIAAAIKAGEEGD